MKPENFNAELTPGNVKQAMKASGSGSRDLWQVDPANLRTMPGFNVRTDDDEHRAHVRAIADSILASGFHQYQPLGGIVATDGIYIHAGHCRLEAVKLAIAEGAQIERVPVVMSPAGTSMEDLTVELVSGNSGKPLSTYENAIVCKRLARFGWSSADICKRLGYASAQYVDGLLMLAAAPAGLRNLVTSGAVSATHAIAMLAKHGAEAEALLMAALMNAKGGRVTAADMPGARLAKAIKRNAAPMYELLGKVQSDPAYKSLSPALRVELAGLLSGVRE